mmetsp:Transcript_122472/g.291119  ORF Transcript_122472/g.291119 Transcript_122472/m.291119 type:complete len:207 (-) Transcript_122472:97-717(-)
MDALKTAEVALRRLSIPSCRCRVLPSGAVWALMAAGGMVLDRVNDFFLFGAAEALNLRSNFTAQAATRVARFAAAEGSIGRTLDGRGELVRELLGEAVRSSGRSFMALLLLVMFHHQASRACCACCVRGVSRASGRRNLSSGLLERWKTSHCNLRWRNCWRFSCTMALMHLSNRSVGEISDLLAVLVSEVILFTAMIKRCRLRSSV